MTHQDLILRLEQSIRIVPDFPKPGISFKDITPILLDPLLMEAAAFQIADSFANEGVTRVIGIESRGFLLGPMIAKRLGCGFVIVRKQGKLPPETTAIHYQLEYGSATIEINKHALDSGDKVLIHDDLLATGGTAAACAQLCQSLGSLVVGFGFLIELAFLDGKANLKRWSDRVESLLIYKE